MSFPIASYVHGGFTALAVLATLIPISKATSKWVRFCDFPRAQIAIIIAILLITAYWAYSEPKQVYTIGAILVLALAYQVYWIWPFTPLAHKEVKIAAKAHKERTFSLMIYNVRMDNQQYQAMLDRVDSCDPDLILANEVNQWWVDNLKALKEKYPYQVLQPQENTYGMALYSRLELTNVGIKFTVEEGIPSVYAQVHLPDGSIFDFHGLHPQPPDLHNDTEARDAELVLTGIQIKKGKRPAVVAGDLNDVAWSHTTRLFKRLSGMLDPRTGRGFYNTYSVFFPFFRYPLDHLFITSHFQLVEIKRLPACGSDHFPVFAKLEYVPEEKMQQPSKKPDSEDFEHAEEILEEAKESDSTNL